MKTNVQIVVFLILVAFLVPAGCREIREAIKPEVYQLPYNSGKYVRVKSLTDKDKISLLDQEAKKRHLKFRIYCLTYQSEQFPDWKFQAEAQQSATDWGLIYVEDGATPWWAGDGPSQADAAFDLYKKLVGGQSPIQPSHREIPSRENEKICPPEIYGGEK